VYLRDQPKTKKKSDRKTASNPATKPVEQDTSPKPVNDTVLDGACQLFERLSVDGK